MRTRHIISVPSETRASNPRPRHLAAALCLLAGTLAFSPISGRCGQNGIWLDGNGSWSQASKWSGNIIADGATFTNFYAKLTANRTLTVDASHTIGAIWNNDASSGLNNKTLTYTPSGGSILTFDNGGTLPPAIRVGVGGTIVMNVPLAGTQGIRFQGKNSGGQPTITLGAANTYSGNTEILAEGSSSPGTTLKIAIANAIPHGPGMGNVILTPNGALLPTLDLQTINTTINGLSAPVGGTVTSSSGAGTTTLTVGDGDATATFAGVIANGASRTLALLKTGAGTQTLTAANTYSGATTVLAGTLQLTGSGAITGSPIILGGTGTLDVAGVTATPYEITASQTLSGSGGTGNILGATTLDTGASLSFTYVAGTPPINVSSGTLTLNGNNATVIATGAPLGTGSYKLISVSGTGAVAGTVGSATVTGLGIIGGGTPSLSIVGNELYLDITSGVPVLEWGSANGTWALGTSGWGSGGSTVWADGDAALLSDRYSSGNPILTLNTEVLPQSVYASSTKQYTISGSGDIGGSASLNALGPGSLTVDVANKHTGGTTLFGGTLNLKNSSALGDSTTLPTFTISGGTLDNTKGTALIMANYPQAWNADVVFTGSSDLDLGLGAVTMGGSRIVTVSANTLTVGGDISGAGFNVVKAGAGTLALNGALGTTTGTVTMNAGTLALGGNNTFTGGVTINLGEVIVGNDGALNSSSPVSVTFPTDANTKTLSLNGHSLTVRNLAMGIIVGGTATVVRNNHASTAVTLTVNATAASQYAGTITDGGAAHLALTKAGSANWTFGGGGVGSGTYSGDTTINSGGTLTAGANNILPFGAGKGNVIVNGTFDILDRSAMGVNGLSGSGTVDRSNPGGSPNCTLTIGNGDASGSFSGRIRNTGSGATLNVTKTGTGTQALSGANTYTGTTIVNGGTLLVNSPGSLAGGSAVTVNANATLGGSGTINGSVTVNSGGTVSAGSSAATLTLANGLSLGSGATNVWELAANDTLSPGTSFDQVALTGGSLALDPASVLMIKFIGTATSPSLANSFWQYVRQWQVIAGSNPGPSNFGGIDGTNGITAGTFTTTADGNGVTLVYTPSVAPPAPTPVTTMNLTPGPGSDYTLTYSGGTGAQFVLITSPNVDTPLNSWTPVATNLAFSGSFTIPIGPNPQGFYRIISE